MKRGLRCRSSIQGQIFPQCTVVEFHGFLAGVQHSAIQEISPSKQTQTKTSATFLLLMSQFASSAFIARCEICAVSPFLSSVVRLTSSLTVNHLVVRDSKWVHRWCETFSHCGTMQSKTNAFKTTNQTVYPHCPHCKLVLPLACLCLAQKCNSIGRFFR